jgi:transcriptional regulator with XRE-family HTH domain
MKNENMINGKAVIESILKQIGPSFGQRVRHSRESLKLTKAELAAYLKVDESKVSEIEGGKRAVTFDIATLLAEKLKSRVEWLLDEKVFVAYALKHIGPDFGKRVKDCRESLNLTKADLAAHLMLDESNVSEIEAGDRPVTIKDGVLLAEKLNSTTEWLIEGKK